MLNLHRLRPRVRASPILRDSGPIFELPARELSEVRADVPDLHRVSCAPRPLGGSTAYSQPEW
eukprot:3696600-Pyramimonas_sp.AAC.1